MKPFLYLCCIVTFACDSKPDLPEAAQAGWHGTPVAEILQDDAHLRVFRCTFPPGVGHEKHYHPPHFGYTVKGSTFKITDDRGTRTVEVPSGTYFRKEERSVHEVQNVGDSTAVFLIYEPK